MGRTILSNAASWIQQIALNWLVYNLTGSGTMLATINMVWAASSLVMIPFAGVLIDCVNHRNLLLVKNLWLFAIALGLGLILLFGRSNIFYLFIFAFLGGLTQTLDQTLEQVAIFDLVPRAETLNAEALIQTGWAITRSFGPGNWRLSYSLVWSWRKLPCPSRCLCPHSNHHYAASVSGTRVLYHLGFSAREYAKRHTVRNE